MDKRDIYEHLANIYLDASSDKKKKNRKKHRSKKYIFGGCLFLILLSVVSFASLNRKGSPRASEVALILSSDAAKINFNFDPAKKEAYSFKLNGLNLSHYKTLAFSLRKHNFQNRVSLRVEFTNLFNEKSNLYLKDVPHQWRDYAVSLSEFKEISYWAEMSDLSFIVEEWNAKDKQDVIYIDDIRLLR